MDDVAERLNRALEGRYRIRRRIGAGGMATVYLAEDLRHGREVALKVLEPGLAAVVGADRFLAEIRTTATLQHPHILPLFDSGESDGLLYYVLPYVDGESLRERTGRRIAYIAAHTGQSRRIWVRDADASTPPRLLMSASGHMHLFDWLPDGSSILASQSDPVTDEDIWLVDVDAGSAERILAGRAFESWPFFSPDGDWIVYVSSESGRPEVWAVPFPELAPARQVTSGGADLPFLSTDAGELFFQRAGDLMRAAISWDDGVRVSDIEALFTLPRYSGWLFLQPSPTAPAGFLMLAPNPDALAREIHVLTGWFQELEARFDAR